MSVMGDKTQKRSTMERSSPLLLPIAEQEVCVYASVSTRLCERLPFSAEMILKSVDGGNGGGREGRCCGDERRKFSPNSRQARLV